MSTLPSVIRSQSWPVLQIQQSRLSLLKTLANRHGNILNYYRYFRNLSSWFDSVSSHQIRPRARLIGMSSKLGDSVQNYDSPFSPLHRCRDNSRLHPLSWNSHLVQQQRRINNTAAAMGKSRDQVKIVLNPDIKYWSQIFAKISEAVGWPFTVEDYNTWRDSFDGKYWLCTAIEKETDECVGCIMMGFDRSVSGREDENCYSIGMYFVRPEWRNTGIGTALFEKLMEIGQGTNMALLGVLDMSQKYASKFGFDKMPSYEHIIATIPTDHLIIPRPDPRYTLKDLNDVDRAQVAAYDSSVSNRSRAKYLHNFISTDNCHVKVAFDHASKIVGFCNFRAVLPNNLSAAPFYAENEVVARTLLAGVLSTIKNIRKYKTLESVYPDTNMSAKRLFESIGGGHTKIEPIFKCAFTKKVLPVVEPKVFGILECANCFV